MVFGRDMSLASLLHEAFKLLELRFRAYDQDGASTLMYKELEHQLSLVGFCDQEKLEALFKRCSLPRALPLPAARVRASRLETRPSRQHLTPTAFVNLDPLEYTIDKYSYILKFAVVCAAMRAARARVRERERQGGPGRKRDSGLQRVSLFALPVG